MCANFVPNKPARLPTDDDDTIIDIRADHPNPNKPTTDQASCNVGCMPHPTLPPQLRSVAHKAKKVTNKAKKATKKMVRKVKDTVVKTVRGRKEVEKADAVVVDDKDKKPSDSAVIIPSTLVLLPDQQSPTTGDDDDISEDSGSVRYLPKFDPDYDVDASTGMAKYLPDSESQNPPFSMLYPREDTIEDLGRFMEREETLTSIPCEFDPEEKDIVLERRDSEESYATTQDVEREDSKQQLSLSIR